MEGRDKDEGVVDLSGMTLSSIPNPSPNLGFITKLDLSNNNLELIPESIMARLLNLEQLELHSNQLQTLPNSIGCLSKLKVLDVSSNLLSYLPKTIQNCRALEELVANFNQLTRLPETIGLELNNLRNLSINSNKLVFLPSSTSHMTSLQSLDARLNRLRSLPDGLENLIRLRSLDVGHNFHHLRSLPYSLGLLISLTHLDVSYNSITILPDSVSCLAKLQRLNAEGNPLVRPPPEVVERGVEAVRDHLRARMNGAEKAKKRSLIGRMVRCGTFNVRSTMVNEVNEREEFLSSELHSFEGIPKRRNAGVFSPRHLFSRQRSLPSSPRMHK